MIEKIIKEAEEKISAIVGHPVSVFFTSKQASYVNHEQIRQAVCEQYSLTLNKFLSRCRKRELTEARQVLCWLLLRYTNETQKYIASFVNLDRSTVSVSAKKIDRFISINDEKILTIINNVEKIFFRK